MSDKQVEIMITIIAAIGFIAAIINFIMFDTP